MKPYLFVFALTACGGTVGPSLDAAPDAPGDTQMGVQDSGPPVACPDISSVSKSCSASMKRWCVSGGFMSCPWGSWEYQPEVEPMCEACK